MIRRIVEMEGGRDEGAGILDGRIPAPVPK